MSYSRLVTEVEEPTVEKMLWLKQDSFIQSTCHPVIRTIDAPRFPNSEFWPLPCQRKDHFQRRLPRLFVKASGMQQYER